VAGEIGRLAQNPQDTFCRDGRGYPTRMVHRAAPGEQSLRSGTYINPEAIDCHTLRLQFIGGKNREVFQRYLRHAVRSKGGNPVDSGGGRDVDDCALAAGSHIERGLPHSSHRRTRIDGEE